MSELDLDTIDQIVTRSIEICNPFASYFWVEQKPGSNQYYIMTFANGIVGIPLKISEFNVTNNDPPIEKVAADIYMRMTRQPQFNKIVGLSDEKTPICTRPDISTELFEDSSFELAASQRYFTAWKFHLPHPIPIVHFYIGVDKSRWSLDHLPIVGTLKLNTLINVTDKIDTHKILPEYKEEIIDEIHRRFPATVEYTPEWFLEGFADGPSQTNIVHMHMLRLSRP